MIPSFLFLLYLLSNTILLGLEASEGENGKVSTTRKNVLLSHLSYQLWIFHCGMCSFQLSTLSLLSARKPCAHVHTGREEYAPQQSGTKLLSPEHVFT